MPHALNSIARAVAKGTGAAKGAAQHPMGYAHSNPDAGVCPCASGVVTQADPGAAYLVGPGARS